MKEVDVSTCFDKFVKANTFKDTLHCFRVLTEELAVDTHDHCNVYEDLKSKITTWRARALWDKLDLKINNPVYDDKHLRKDLKVLVIGAGPCGLRSAIEVALLGGKALVLEKRTDVTRNNVLSLWPFVVQDLKSLGAKDYYAPFFVGGKDHIGIKHLQCILLKTALLLGVEVHVDLEFKDLIEPPVDQGTGQGWRCEVEPKIERVLNFEFNAVIGADGKRHSLKGFKRKEFRGKLAIAITANFTNRRTRSEALVPEICGLSYVYNQQFFNNIKSKHDIDLENIVYFKSETHYFVFTAKKDSLLRKGVLIENKTDPSSLLSQDNVNEEKLHEYAKQTAEAATDQKIPDLEFTLNKYEKPDVAMFDFTCLCTAEHSSRIVERNGHKLLQAIVGDSLIEPFWPQGTGAANGFLGVLDTAWMIKQLYSEEHSVLDILAEKETAFKILPQCTSSSLFPNPSQHTIDPRSRYVNLSAISSLQPSDVTHLYDTDTPTSPSTDPSTKRPASENLEGDPEPSIES